MGVSHGDRGMGQWTEILSRMKDSGLEELWFAC